MHLMWSILHVFTQKDQYWDCLLKTCLFSTELPISGQFVDHFYEKNWFPVKSEILVKQKTENAQFKLIRMLVHCIRGQEINKGRSWTLDQLLSGAIKQNLRKKLVFCLLTTKLLPKAKQTTACVLSLNRQLMWHNFSSCPSSSVPTLV